VIANKTTTPKITAMKRIISILVLIITVAVAQAQIVCCPKFSLQQAGDVRTCVGDSSCKGGSAGAAGNPVIQAASIVACKNSTQTYLIVPYMAGFTYSWTVSGGSLQSTTANQGVIVWGNGSQGYIKVIVSNADGSCKDSVFAKVCLIDAPIAAFAVLPGTTVCVTNPTINFTNTSVGATTWSWNFGDGSTSTQSNPSHTFSGVGAYTVTLTVTNQPPGGANGGVERCGCTDTATMVINVVPGAGPTIVSPCKKMLCAGDTATYCASGCTGPYSWTVVGGTPASGTGNCIQVTWNPSPGQQPSITLTAGGGCGPCGNSTTMNVPVLFNNMPITPTNTACQGSTITYSMAALPGTFCNWTVTGGTIVGPTNNTNSITINWGMGPVGTISCNYQNPYTKCNGSTSQTIQIRPVFTMAGPSSVCTGTGTFFSTNGPGNWTIGAPASAYTFGGSLTSVSSVNITSWNTAGTYLISAVPTTPANYCTSSASINLVVKPTPVLSPVTGPNPVCLNGFYVYAVTSNLPGPFTWSIANGNIVSQMGANKDSVVVQWTSAGGTLNVSQTVNGCTGNASLGAVNVIPTPTITGAATVCRDQTPYPAYTASGALPVGSYTWSISPAAAGTIMTGQGTNSITVLWSGAALPGTSAATVSVTVCGNTVSFPVTVTTPPNGVVTATGNLCTTGATLSVSPAMPCYQWYLNGVLIPGATSATYLATTHGYYEVKCPTGCSGYVCMCHE
jgi:PKD repeat protein